MSMTVRRIRWYQKGKKGLSAVKHCQLYSFAWVSAHKAVNSLFVFIHSVMSDSATPWTGGTPGFPVLHHLPQFAQTYVHWVGDAIQLSHLSRPLLLLPSIFPSIRVFPIESALRLRWPKYWSFSVSVSPSNEYSGLISFGIDCFDLLAVQGTVKSLLQHTEHLYASAHPSISNTFEALHFFFFFFNNVFGFFVFTFHLFIFVYLFVFDYSGSSCPTWTSSSCGEPGLLFIGVLGLLNTVASLVSEHRLQAMGLQ